MVQPAASSQDAARVTRVRPIIRRWTGRVGTAIEPDNLRRSWYPLRDRLGLTLRFHDLRHTCVTLLLDLGVPPHIVRQIAGHSDIGVTMKVYAHASLDEQRKALGSLSDRLA
uniref:tyrosine-type recombinase/integrase n=1 Tax=Peterkaempfera griseoplana TaxID=66896 RepID=UPI0006E37F43|nr:tyrosine-type recombinase/integrase [Peterkaempfera griseoplana]